MPTIVMICNLEIRRIFSNMSFYQSWGVIKMEIKLNHLPRILKVLVDKFTKEHLLEYFVGINRKYKLLITFFNLFICSVAMLLC